MRELGLYIHIPFCERKCKYCAFISFEDRSKMDEYVSLLIDEINFTKKDDYFLSSIYIGGGTPSLLEVEHLERIFDCIKKNYQISPDVEITIEINPNSTTCEKLIFYKKIGINRLSIGVQSLDDKVLNILGRLHSSAQAKKVLKLAKKVGFKNISADLILGVPNLRKKHIFGSIKFLKKYCTHISCYTLILEDNTPLHKEVAENKIILPREEVVASQYIFAYKILKFFRFKRYEISSFAKESFQSRHNSKYWDFSEYLGVGISAHSYMDGVRFWNQSSYSGYKKFVEMKDTRLKEKEKISKSQYKEEFLMLSLRKEDGVDLSKYHALFGIDLLVEKNKEIEYLKKAKFINVDKGFLKATFKGSLVLNQIILKLIN